MEIQAASYGTETPAHIITQIEDVRKEITKIDNQLSAYTTRLNSPRSQVNNSLGADPIWRRPWVWIVLIGLIIVGVGYFLLRPQSVLSGTYVVAITESDLAQLSLTKEVICGNIGEFSLTLTDQKYTYSQTSSGRGCLPNVPRIQGTYFIDGDLIIFQRDVSEPPSDCSPRFQYHFRVEGSVLRFEPADDTCIIRKAIFTARAWKRSP